MISVGFGSSMRDRVANRVRRVGLDDEPVRGDLGLAQGASVRSSRRPAAARRVSS